MGQWFPVKYISTKYGAVVSCTSQQNKSATPEVNGPEVFTSGAINIREAKFYFVDMYYRKPLSHMIWYSGFLYVIHLDRMVLFLCI
jgi:hypothetical protein